MTRRSRWGRLTGLLAALMALALFAAACGEDGDDTPSEPAASDELTQPEDTAPEPAATDESADPEGTTPEPAATDEPAEQDDDGMAMADFGTLDYMGWEGYDTFFGVTEAQLAELGIEINATYIGAPSDIVARFASGGGAGIDLLGWTSAEHAPYRATEGVLSPIAPEEVPNLEGLISQFADDEWDHFRDEDGNWLAIPFSFAPLGITYDSSQVSPASYADLLDPELTGQVAIPDVPGLHLQAAAAALGYPAQTLTPDQLDDVIEFMRGIWAQARVLSPSFGDVIGLLASGEVLASYGGYPGLGAFTENPDIVTVFPTEGTFSFVEVYSIPADADNREGALAFINAMLDPEVNAAINDAFAQATTVQASIELISDANKALYPYDDLDAFLAANPVSALPTGEDGSISMGDFIEAYASLSTGG